jgi:FkbM family methyltransferase
LFKFIKITFDSKGNFLGQFTNYLNENPDVLVFDMGAQIGQYSMFAAKMGHTVITIEPFEDNIQRIHKAVYLEQLQDSVVLVKNALSSKRNQILLLSKDSINIGRQTLMNKQNNEQTFFKSDMSTNKYLVETILMDDLIDYIPLNKYGKRHEKAIIKIDIESFEPHAFSNCTKLFNMYDIRLIFMEWFHLIHYKELALLINNMLDFFYSYGLEPYSLNYMKLPKKIRYDDNINWPKDLVWKRIVKNPKIN